MRAAAQRIVYTGKPPLDFHTMHLTPEGFGLTFTQPVDAAAAADPRNYAFRHYFYQYHKRYGSEQQDVQPVAVRGVKVSADGRKVALQLAALKPGYVYELRLGDIRTPAGKALANKALANKIICYTLNKLRL